jgi:uncharacterized protein
MSDKPITVPDELIVKEEALKDVLAGYKSLAIAYSGGVDSAYLSDVANDVLGNKAVVLLADSPSIPRSEVDEARALAAERAWHFEVILTEEFDNEEYLKNDGTRCYHCRTELFDKMHEYAEAKRIPVLAYGAIMDDLLDPTRLGSKAAAEHEVVAPLQVADLGKEEIRQLSRFRGLPTWDKASFACLSSRMPVGTRVTREGLSKVEQAEEVLKGLGFNQYRARHHGELVRVEVGENEVERAFEASVRETIVRELRAVGYRHVTLDLAGYRTGSTAGDPAE